jgi:predicted metalloprotease with PDZ domain
MKRNLTRALTLLTVVVAMNAAADEARMCQSSARECEQQIRSMISGRRYLGVQLVELQPGLTIKSVLPDSPAENADLKAGDRLIAVNGRSLVGGKVQDFKRIIADAKETGRLWMIIQRRGAYRKVEVKLEPYTKEQIDKIVAAHLTQRHPASATREP